MGFSDPRSEHSFGKKHAAHSSPVSSRDAYATGTQHRILSTKLSVCVVVPSILSAGLHLLGAPAGVTQEEGQHTGVFLFCFNLHLPSAVLAFFIARRVQQFLSLVDREIASCLPTTKSLSTVGCCARTTPNHSEI